MSRIDDLLNELAPGGVIYKLLGDVARISSKRVDASRFDAGSYVGVDNLLPDFGGRKDTQYGANSSGAIWFRPGDILIGNIRPYLRKIWMADRDGGASPDVLTISIRPNWQDQVVPRFLYFILASESFIEYSMRHAKGAKMPRGDKSATLKYRIPVPPLEVQNEIVEILDHLTELTADLEAQLQAELAARKVQYSYAREQLLTFTDGADVTWSTLGEISDRVSSGATPQAGRPDYYLDGTIPWLRTQEVRFVDIWDTENRITEKALMETAVKWIPANCVIIAISGATAGRTAVNRIPLTTNQHCCNFQIDPTQANYRYVFYWVRSQYEQIKALGQGARADLNSGIIKSVRIPLPSLAEQERIVGILDKLDSLVNELTSGLSAEVKARRQQYVYYHDKLLTFQEAAP